MYTSGRQKFTLVSLLTKHSLRSAAGRINKSDFRGRYGTVNYHTVLIYRNTRLSGVTNDRPPLPLSHGVGL